MSYLPVRLAPLMKQRPAFAGRTYVPEILGRPPRRTPIEKPPSHRDGLFVFHHLTPALPGPAGAAPIGSSDDFSPGTVDGVFNVVSPVTTSLLLAQPVR